MSNNTVLLSPQTSGEHQKIRRFKCKKCGIDIVTNACKDVVTCDFCETLLNVPKMDYEDSLNCYVRASNHIDSGNFHNAIIEYNKVIESDNTDANAYWLKVLAKYGVIYDDDNVPSCCRPSYDSIFTDKDYQMAIKNASGIYQKLYFEFDAIAIDHARNEIVARAEDKKKYDIFICSVSTDTTATTKANEIKHVLSSKGFKVFYQSKCDPDLDNSSIILSALHSSKIMIVVGTAPAHFIFTPVNEEWSRFLQMMENDSSKVLISGYENMTVYKLPNELRKFASYDLSGRHFLERDVANILRGNNKK